MSMVQVMNVKTLSREEQRTFRHARDVCSGALKVGSHGMDVTKVAYWVWSQEHKKLYSELLNAT